MKPALKHALAAIVLLLTLAAPVAAGPLEDAKAASTLPLCGFGVR
jgi:hypothetical protein